MIVINFYLDKKVLHSLNKPFNFSKMKNVKTGRLHLVYGFIAILLHPNIFAIIVARYIITSTNNKNNFV